MNEEVEAMKAEVKQSKEGLEGLDLWEPNWRFSGCLAISQNSKIEKPKEWGKD